MLILNYLSIKETKKVLHLVIEFSWICLLYYFLLKCIINICSHKMPLLYLKFFIYCIVLMDKKPQFKFDVIRIKYLILGTLSIKLF